MIITITRNNGEFVYHIVTDGEKCSIVEQDADKVLTRFGKISINGDASLEGKITTKDTTRMGEFIEKITKEEMAKSNRGCKISGNGGIVNGTVVFLNPPVCKYM